ncbi:MAG: hypothetical protein ABI840_05595 [bacterium]
MNKTKCIISIFLFILAILISGCEKDTTPTSTSGIPFIEFISIPSYGNTTQPLVGRISNIDPNNFKVCVYINIEGYGWVIKPDDTQNYLIPIDNSGMITCPVVTGGIDETFSCVAIFVLPNGITPPLLLGSPEIPEHMYNYANLYQLRYRRSITFANREFWVKTTPLIAGPGPNYFLDNSENVFVENGNLHMRITNSNNYWYCSEIISKDVLGYGKYVFKIASPVGSLDENVVLGLFTWDMSKVSSHREIDIEFIKTCSPHNGINSQYAIQPFSAPGHLYSWLLPTWVNNSSHSFEWKQDAVNFKSSRGFNPEDTVYQTWSFSGNSVPRHNKENVRINLWLCNGKPPTDMQETEVVIYDFDYSEN